MTGFTKISEEVMDILILKKEDTAYILNKK